MRKLGLAIPLVLLIALLIPNVVALAWNGGVSAVPDCNGVVVSASPSEYPDGSWTKWVPETIVGTGTFAWGSDTHKSGNVDITWRKYQYEWKDGKWQWVKKSNTHTESFPWAADRPYCTCDVTNDVPGEWSAWTVDPANPAQLVQSRTVNQVDSQDGQTICGSRVEYNYMPRPVCQWDPNLWADDPACVPPPPDLCTNLEGIQEVMPEGYEDPDQDGICTEVPPPPVDMCPNIEGVQETVPEGLIVDEFGNCVEPPTPTEVPPTPIVCDPGYHLEGDQCVPDATPTVEPTIKPTDTPVPTVEPTEVPPTMTPTVAPTATPEPTSTVAPTATPEPTKKSPVSLPSTGIGTDLIMVSVPFVLGGGGLVAAALTRRRRQ